MQEMSGPIVQVITVLEQQYGMISSTGPMRLAQVILGSVAFVALDSMLWNTKRGPILHRSHGMIAVGAEANQLSPI